MHGQNGRLAMCAAFTMTALFGCAPSLRDIDLAVEHQLAESRASIEPTLVQPSVGSKTDSPEAIELGENSSLGECLRYAAANNSELQAAFYRWQAALERVPQVTAMPDPRVSYGYFLNEIETRVGPQQHRFSVSQVFPWFGELDLRGDVSAKAATVEWDKMNAIRLDIAQAVKTRYNELFYLRQAIALARENLELLQRFEEIARVRYRVAAGKHPDIIRTQVELGTLEDRVLELLDQRRPLTARLNATLNRALDAPGPWPSDIPEPKIEIDHAALIAAIGERNPRLAALLSESEKHRAAAALARTDYYPDFTLKLDYIVTGEAMNSSINESGDDGVIAGISFNLPIWRESYEAGVRESLKRRLGTAAQRVDLTNQLHAALEMALFRYRDSRRKIALYRDTLLPKAMESLNAALGGYQGATIPFTDLLDAQRVLLDLQLAEARARTDAAIAIADIEAIISDDLAAIDAPTEDHTP